MRTGVLEVLYWTSIISSFVAPVLLLVLFFLTGRERAHKFVVGALGWITIVVMFISAVGTVLTWDKH